MAGELVDVHHSGVLCDGEGVLLLGLHECEVGWLWSLALLLCLVDALLCLVDFDEVCVHAALYDAVINHSSVGFRFTELSHEGSYRSYRSYHSLRSLEVKANSLLG